MVRKFVARNVTEALRRALGDSPVVLLKGARQTGKSTLVEQVIAQGHRAAYVTLDETVQRAAAVKDPDGFIASFSGNVAIDEVQHAPDLFFAIKVSVDRNRRPGRFLLTGSADVLLLPKVSESLAGRMQMATLWPFSQGELEGRRDEFVDVVFRERLPLVEGSTDMKRDALRRALRGGFPQAVAREDTLRRAEWFNAYVDTILQREVRELSKIEGLVELPSLLSLLAARAASILNVAELSRVSGLRYMTLKRYLALFELVFVFQRIRPWSGGLRRRHVRHPKVALVDTGLLAHLLGVDLNRFDRDPSLAGAILENFVVAELTKQLTWSAEVGTGLYHYRSQAGEEVDAVLERRDGTIVGIEVRASANVGAPDFRGLRALAEDAGVKFVRGIVLYTGRQTVGFAKNLHALPVSALWKL